MNNRIITTLFTSALLVGSHSSANAGSCDMTIGVGTAQANLSTVRWPAGGTVCINPGSYANMLVVFEIRRSAKAPLLIRATDANNPPKLLGGSVIRNSSYVTVQQLDVSYPNGYAAMLVDQGSHHVTIENIKAHDAPFGVVFGSSVQSDGLGGPAGASNVVRNSTLGTNVNYSGVAVNNGSGGAVASTDPNYPYATSIIGNIVSGNAGHGISIDNAKYVKVERNQLSNNGYGGGGYSGIHMYSNEDNGRCGNNLVRYNFVSDTKMRSADISATDGNGILMDHFCDSNDVSFNVVWGNFGNGISIFTSANNQVYNNTVYGNTQQPNRTVIFPPAWNRVAEISVSTCASVNTVNRQSDCGGVNVYPTRASNNRVFNNIIQPTVYGVTGVRLSAAATAASLNNSVGPNMYWVGGDAADRPSANWPPFYSGSTPTTQFSVAYVDGATGTSGNLIERPSFDKDITQVAPGAAGLRVARRPSTQGQVLTNPPRDFADTLPATGSSFFGAYYCNAASAGGVCVR